jgi:hypothetical protein
MLKISQTFLFPGYFQNSIALIINACSGAKYQNAGINAPKKIHFI